MFIPNIEAFTFDCLDYLSDPYCYFFNNDLDSM